MKQIDTTRKASYHSADYTIRIHGFQDQILEGSIENWNSCETISFQGLVSMLEVIDKLINDNGFPQAAMNLRSWELPAASILVESARKEPAVRSELGKEAPLATLILRVQFRQNASWQGNLAWLEARRSMAFRSVLEMTRLLDQAVQQAANSSRAAPAPRPEHRWKAKESVS